MATGDLGGPVTELIITCRARGPVKRGDALTLCGPYEVTPHGYKNLQSPMGRARIFGQAMMDAAADETIPVKVRGVAIFKYDASMDALLHLGKFTGASDREGYDGARMSETAPGIVGYERGPNCGVILKVDRIAGEVHVLL